jgi:hypothetical protein
MSECLDELAQLKGEAPHTIVPLYRARPGFVGLPVALQVGNQDGTTRCDKSGPIPGITLSRLGEAVE